MAGREVTEAAQQLAVGEELESVVHVTGAGQGQSAVRKVLDLDADAVPAITGVAGMTLCRPSWHIAGDGDDGIEGARGRRQVDVFPMGVVKARFGPQRPLRGRIDGRVADAEL